MRYYLILLFTVKLLSQDYLVTLSGNQAQGKYIDIDDTHLHFQQKGSNVVSKIPISSLIQVVLSDGTVIYEQGGYAEKIPLAIEGYQKLSTKEKAFYDAAGDAKKWLFYPPTTVLTLAASSGSYFVVTGHHPLESITASIISVFGLVVPYYGFKYLDKNQDVEISPEDIQRYKRIYSEEFKKRKSKNIVKGFGLLGLTAAAGYFYFLTTFSLDDDFSFGP